MYSTVMVECQASNLRFINKYKVVNTFEDLIILDVCFHRQILMIINVLITTEQGHGNICSIFGDHLFDSFLLTSIKKQMWWCCQKLLDDKEWNYK